MGKYFVKLAGKAKLTKTTFEALATMMAKAKPKATVPVKTAPVLKSKEELTKLVDKAPLIKRTTQ